MPASPSTSHGGAAAAGVHTLLTTVTLGAPGTFDVSSISGGYNDLVGVLIARGTGAGTSETVKLNPNADTGANYNRETLQYVGNAAPAGAETLGGASLGIGAIPNSGSPANAFGVIQFVVFGYASTSWHKTVLWQAYGFQNNTNSNVVSTTGGGSWNSTAALNRMQIAGTTTANFATGSQLRIYGRS